MHPVSPYPNTVLATWQLVLIAVVATAGIAAWLGAVFYAARDPRPSAHAAAASSPAQPAASTSPLADAPPLADASPLADAPALADAPPASPVPAAAGPGHRTAA
jgi:hypothetical protein